MTFTPEQLKELKAPLSRDHVSERKQGSFKLSYIEGWHAIAEANRIFGFASWTREISDLRCVDEGKYKTSKGQDSNRCSYVATVRITVYTEDGIFPIVREGTGAGHGFGSLGEAHESAAKEAETDAMKRAFMTFGNPFGLALYDKTQKNVTSKGRGFSGPLPMTKLKDALRAFESDMRACEDEDQLLVLLESGKELTDQCQRDIPKWWSSWKTGTGEMSVGIEERIEQAKQRVKENQT